MLSMTLQLTISKTRKRLFRDDWSMPTIFLGLIILFTISIFALRAASLGWNFGLVSAKIPQLVSEDRYEEPASLQVAAHALAQKSENVLGDGTITVVLGNDALFFGPIEAFSTKLGNVRNKFKVPHVNGSPQVGQMLSDLKKWSLLNRENLPKVAILVPFPGAPMPIVIEVIDRLKSAGGFSDVVLGSGLQ